MRFVIYTHYFSSGGAEKRASIYANYLFEQGIDVILVTMHKRDNEYYLHPEIPRYYVSNSYEEYNKLSKKQRLEKLRELLVLIKPDVVMSFLTTYGLYAMLATRKVKELSNVKHIYAVSLYQRKYNLINRIVDFLCCLLADRISLQCKEQIKCNRLFKKKCFVNYNPINDKWNDKTIQRSYDSIKAISVGRLTKQKNFVLSIKSVAKAHKNNNDISLDIFGNGPLKEKLNDLISKLDAEDYIKIHDFSLDLPSEFERHNVFISTSKFEGFPNGLTEGMMSGLIGISTPCPTGPKEIICDGENGFIVKSKNELVNLLQRLGSSRVLCEKISSESRKSIKSRFEDEVVLTQFLKEISNI